MLYRIDCCNNLCINLSVDSYNSTSSLLHWVCNELLVSPAVKTDIVPGYVHSVGASDAFCIGIVYTITETQPVKQ